MGVLATLAAAAVGVGVAKLVRLPGAALLGALFGAATLHLLVALPPLPDGVHVAAQIAIGAVIGSRLRPAVWRDARRWAPAFAVALLVLLITAAIGAQILVIATEMSWRTALLAVAPGGAADVTVLAVAAGEDSTVVATIHTVRQLLVFVGLGGTVRWWSVTAGDTSGGHLRRTAGAVVWRSVDGDVQILLVHRPRYDDWSLPKGGIDPGETAREAAVREAREETGWQGVVGRDLGTVELRERRGPHGRKCVDFFAVEAVEEVGFRPSSEVDDVRWVALGTAAAHCSRPQDREVLGRFAAFDQEATGSVDRQTGSADDASGPAG